MFACFTLDAGLIGPMAKMHYATRAADSQEMRAVDVPARSGGCPVVPADGKGDVGLHVPPLRGTVSLGAQEAFVLRRRRTSPSVVGR